MCRCGLKGREEEVLSASGDEKDWALHRERACSLWSASGRSWWVTTKNSRHYHRASPPARALRSSCFESFL